MFREILFSKKSQLSFQTLYETFLYTINYDHGDGTDY
jgi:hypothetical protein